MIVLELQTKEGVGWEPALRKRKGKGGGGEGGVMGGHVRMMCRENKNKSQVKSKSEF